MKKLNDEDCEQILVKPQELSPVMKIPAMKKVKAIVWEVVVEVTPPSLHDEVLVPNVPVRQDDKLLCKT